VTLYVQIAPIERPPAESGMIIICWPQVNGDHGSKVRNDMRA
jgi:hypothetical protein